MIVEELRQLAREMYEASEECRYEHQTRKLENMSALITRAAEYIEDLEEQLEEQS